LQVGENGLAEPERPFVVYIFVADGPIFVSQVEDARDDDPDPEADGKKHAVSWESDEDHKDNSGGNDQAGCTSDVDGETG